MKKFTLILSLSVGMLFGGAVKAQSFFEDFEDITTLTGWDTIQVSNPMGSITNWFQGNTGVFPSYSNAGYIAANFNMTAGTGTISAWLVSPAKWMHDGDKIIFATRKTDSGATNYPDRLQVRLSTMGAGSILPTSETDLGDFTTLLLDINPNYSNNSSAGGYPYNWKSYTLTLSGLPNTMTGCRFAFRYFVENAGPTGANSDYIGIDSVAYVTNFNGVEENYGRTEFSFYPNPSKGTVNVHVKAVNGQDRNITVTDMLGNVVFENTYSNAHFSMDLSNLSKGLYFINIKDDKGISSKKLVIE